MKDKKYWIVDGPLRAEHLPRPNKAQLESAVLPEDIRWRPSLLRRIALHPFSVLLIVLALGLFIYVLIQIL